jgi:hypothetical protein
MSDEGYSRNVLFNWLSNLSILSVPDEGYSRNASGALNLISTFLLWTLNLISAFLLWTLNLISTFLLWTLMDAILGFFRTTRELEYIFF